MSEFEFVFSLFGLLLGFSLVEVLGGLARTAEGALRARRPGGPPFRAGWLTPMLGLFVMLDLLSFWHSAWVLRDRLHVGGAALTVGLFFTSAYYLLAHLVFPREPSDSPDLDRHYFEVKRIVLGGLLVLLGVQLAFYATVPELRASLLQPWVAAKVGLFVALIAATAAVRGRRANALLLGLLVVRYVWEGLT